MSLLRFCYAGRPKSFAFTSSSSTSMGSSAPSLIPEAPISSDPSVALSTGYAQSKYIIERITQTASLPTALNIPITLLRVGQLCGHTRTGRWNTNEMWPIMFATSAHPGIHALPVFPKKGVDWIPVDIAASAIGEVLLSSDGKGLVRNFGGEEEESEIGGEYKVHNIVNPSSIPWSFLLRMLQSSSLAAAGKLEEVSMHEWVRRLNAVTEQSVDVPGARLLGFFEDMVGDEGESKVFETGKSREVSWSLRECGPFCGEWVEGNVKGWRESGFLS
jgi:nucleoside-diphosphate-sugar epimerase